MKNKGQIANIEIHYKDDDCAKERLIEFIINCLLENDLLKKGGDHHEQS